MAYRLICDNESCAAEISTGPGQPALHARQHIYCPACSVYIEQVEAQLRKEMTQFAMDGATRLAERRKELMAKIMPENRGGTGEGLPDFPQVVNG